MLNIQVDTSRFMFNIKSLGIDETAKKGQSIPYLMFTDECKCFWELQERSHEKKRIYVYIYTWCFETTSEFHKSRVSAKELIRQNMKSLTFTDCFGILYEQVFGTFTWLQIVIDRISCTFQYCGRRLHACHLLLILQYAYLLYCLENLLIVTSIVNISFPLKYLFREGLLQYSISLDLTPFDSPPITW